jgi:hypothetical protein
MREAGRHCYINWNVCRKMNNHSLMGLKCDAKLPAIESRPDQPGFSPSGGGIEE